MCWNPHEEGIPIVRVVSITDMTARQSSDSVTCPSVFSNIEIICVFARAVEQDWKPVYIVG